MKMLEDKILKEGKVIGNHILKVDSFINHQLDIELFNEMGKEFKRLYKGSEVTKILTIEASGIAIASIVAQYFNVPVVFAKKYAGTNMDNENYETEVFSYTKNTMYKVRVSKNYISPSDKVLIIDDFLARGSALLGLIDLVRQSGADIVGAGIVIEKAFQNSRELIEKEGVRLESLAVVQKMEEGKVFFNSQKH